MKVIRMAAGGLLVGVLGPGQFRAQPLLAQTPQPERIYTPGNGITYPRVVREVRPDFTPEGLRAKTQGEVEIEAVVLADGSVGEVRVVKSLDRLPWASKWS